MPGTTYLVNPNANLAGQFNPATAGNNQQSFRGPDPQCAALGGEVLLGTCNFQFSFYDNLVEKTNTYKTYAEFNYDISDSSKFHIEGDVLVPGHAALAIVARISAELAVRSGSRDPRY